MYSHCLLLAEGCVCTVCTCASIFVTRWKKNAAIPRNACRIHKIKILLAFSPRMLAEVLCCVHVSSSQTISHASCGSCWLRLRVYVYMRRDPRPATMLCAGLAGRGCMFMCTCVVIPDQRPCFVRVLLAEVACLCARVVIPDQRPCFMQVLPAEIVYLCVHVPLSQISNHVLCRSCWLRLCVYVCVLWSQTSDHASCGSCWPSSCICVCVLWSQTMLRASLALCLCVDVIQTCDHCSY